MIRILTLALAVVVAGLTGCSEVMSKLPNKKASASSWLTDLEHAKAKAKAEGKTVLVNFTGSDWCGWCIKLREEVFSKPAFVSYARSNLVLVEIDFPHHKDQSAQQKRANEALAEQYKVQGFPTVLVMGGDGQVLGRTGYLPGGPAAFIGELMNIGRQNPSPGVAAPQARDLSASDPDLRLKGISGLPGNRLALINNTTMAAGESATVKIGADKVNIRCIAILDETVVVSMEGKDEPIELRLSGRL